MARTWSLAVAPYFSDQTHAQGFQHWKTGREEGHPSQMEEGEAESPPLGKETTKSWLSKSLWVRYYDEWNRSWSHLLEGLAFYRDL